VAAVALAFFLCDVVLANIAYSEVPFGTLNVVPPKFISTQQHRVQHVFLPLMLHGTPRAARLEVCNGCEKLVRMKKDCLVSLCNQVKVMASISQLPRLLTAGPFASW